MIIVLLVLFLFVGHDGPIVATAADDAVTWSFCDTTSNYTAQSIYQSNLDLLSAALSKNASSSLLFAKGSVGVAPDTVYGVTLCRGDFSSNASACGECVADAFRQAQRQKCPLAKRVFIVSDAGCQLRFSDKDILNRSTATDIYGYGDVMILMNALNFTQPMLPGLDAGNAESMGIITNIIKMLVQETAKAAAYNNSAYYATGRMDVSSTFPTLYSMAQCTPDMRPDDCWGCLQAINSNLTTTYLAGRRGGRILDIWCNFRYETYTFYRGEPTRRIGSSGDVIPPPTPPPPPEAVPSGDQQHRRSSRSKIVVISTVVALVSSVCCAIFCFGLVRKYKKGKVSLQGNMNMPTDEEALTWGIEASSSEFTLFDLSQVLDATNNFAEENMLGKGGFGPVYKPTTPAPKLEAFSNSDLEQNWEGDSMAQLGKGLFSDGSEIAVKRLASHSGQDEQRRVTLNWNNRLAIIEGIAQGLLYLHKHSRLRVIHRDLKASNILLDSEMNPKISDFGLARIFSSKDTEENTNRIVGTYGYMAPEYASEGLFSVKSDVFSFGVLILEIVSGKRNSGFHQCGDFFNLLGYMMRCINIALLCVQENAVDRPSMSDVVVMLSSENIALSGPNHPAYFHIRVTKEEASTSVESSGLNNTTMSILYGR
uniref:Protein kinase domain-containing protein n=1 Tax=Leersia perrieri TaxID=77586 RepID=A0A0D9XZG0_9ORYZ